MPTPAGRTMEAKGDRTNAGVVCGLKRFAVHDGPGIRSTLFLKGCPMRCAWCHNPEALRPEPELGIRSHACALCGDCAQCCPRHRIEDGRHLFDRKHCAACGKCVKNCFFDALDLYGKTMTPDEAAAAILEDRLFYENSGGGATLSGGEPLLQPGFCAALLPILKRGGVHTAVDTCGDVPWAAFEAVLSATDMFLYDFKHPDDGKHRELTGRGNGRIKENLLRLGTAGKPIEIRMPMVPGLNMDEAALAGAGAFLATVAGVTRVCLLPYHALARPKYETVGRPDTLPPSPAPTAKELERAGDVLRACGAPVQRL